MKKSLQIDDFWKKYHDAVLKRSVPRYKAEWYMKWAQKFAVSAPGPLRSKAGYRRLLSGMPPDSMIFVTLIAVDIS